MFIVKAGSNNNFVCTCKVKLFESRHLSVSEAEGVVDVPLGVSSDAKAAKVLMPLFEKELAKAEKRAAGFIADIEKESAALEKMILAFDRRPAAERSKANYEQLVAWVARENSRISLLWKRWCEIHARKMAEDALATCLKTTLDKSVRDLAAAKKAAVGRATKLPTFQMVAGAVSIATGGVTGFVLGALKLAAAYVDDQRNAQKALQLYSDGQAEVSRDLARFREALDALAARVARVDARRAELETMIIQNTQSAQKILREAAALKAGAKGSAVKDAERLNAALDLTMRSTQALAGQIIDPAPLENSLKVIAAEHARMATHLKVSVSKSEAAARDYVTILKTTKEVGDILKGLASLES